MRDRQTIEFAHPGWVLIALIRELLESSDCFLSESVRNVGYLGLVGVKAECCKRTIQCIFAHNGERNTLFPSCHL